MKDFQTQLERRDKQNTLLSDDVNKARDRISNLLSTIDELQTSDSTTQLTAKRAERELREEKEKVLRLERELEGWKVLRLERGSNRGGLAPPVAPGSRSGSDYGSIRGRREGSVALGADKNELFETPPNRALRRVSGTKGFL